MSSTRLLFEGPDIHAVLAQVRGEYGTDVRIVAADKVRSGGIAGFFVRERFEVAVEIDLDNAASASQSDADPGTAGVVEDGEDRRARDLGTLIVSSPGHPPVIEDSAELPPSVLLDLISSANSVDSTAPSRPRPDSATALHRVGLPNHLIPERQPVLPTYEALLAALADAARAPQLPATPGEVIAVVGTGAEVLAAAELVVASLGGDRAAIELVAGRSAEHAPGPLRMWGPADARRRAARLARRNTPTVVAIDRSHDLDGSWTAQVLAALDVSAVCAVIDARTKPRDLEAHVRSLGRVEALVVNGCARTVDPGTVFGLGIPIIAVDGRPSSARVWAGILAGLMDEGTAPR